MKNFFIFTFLIISLCLFSQEKINKNLFGIHFHSVKTFNENLEGFPLNTIRIWDAGVIWPDLEKKKDEWNFKKLDEIVDFALSHNMEIIMTLGQTPGWATFRENYFYPYGRDDIRTHVPDNFEDWYDYINTLGNRYKGKIKYWEVWNEPDDLNFYEGSPKELFELTKIASMTLKEIDPENKIISPSITGLPSGLWFLDRYLALGAKNYIDIIGFHYYVSDFYPPELLKTHVSIISQILKKHKVLNIPLWSTEGGVFIKELPFKNMVSLLSRLYLMKLTSGVERFYWYAYDGGPSDGFVNIEDIGLNQTGRAYQILFYWLNGKTIISENDNFGIKIIELKNDPKTSYILWNPFCEVNFNIPKNWSVSAFTKLNEESKKISGNRIIKVGKIPVLVE